MLVFLTCLWRVLINCMFRHHTIWKINFLNWQSGSLVPKIQCLKHNRPLALRDHVNNASFKQWLDILRTKQVLKPQGAKTTFEEQQQRESIGNCKTFVLAAQKSFKSWPTKLNTEKCQDTKCQQSKRWQQWKGWKWQWWVWQWCQRLRGEGDSTEWRHSCIHQFKH